MKPVDQEFIHDPENDSYGDCQRAVIASILELPISDVPHFYMEAAGDSRIFWSLINHFVKQKGYKCVDCEAEDVKDYGFHEIAGPSPRCNDVYHAVVGFNGEIVHDPHPSKVGLLEDRSQWIYMKYEKIDQDA